MKKSFCLLLCLLIFASLPLTAFADAWIPQEEDSNENLIALPEKNGDCYALNAFLSYFAETQLTELIIYDVAPEEYCAVLLKHFELNPRLYPDDVSSFHDAQGNTYMQISESKFESCMVEFFGMDISATQCPGYKDGRITVSAENYGAEKLVFASSINCSIMGHELYYVSFEIYEAQDPSAYLSTANTQLDQATITHLADGYCLIRYEGSLDQTAFKPSDFTLYEFYLSNESGSRPYGNKNLPYEADTAAATESGAKESSAPSEQASSAEARPSEQRDGYEEEKAATKRTLLLTAVIVLSAALGALLVILLVFKKKDPKDKAN